MVVVVAADAVYVHRNAGALREAVQAVGNHLTAKVSDLLAAQAEFADAVRAVREVDDGAREGLVEGAVGGAEAGEAGGCVEGGFEGLDSRCLADIFVDGTVGKAYLTERNESVLCGVVVVDVKITASTQAHAPAAVLGEGVQHVVQEANAGVYADLLRLGVLCGMLECRAIGILELGQSAAVEVERKLDLRLVGVAVDGRDSDALLGRHAGQIGCA